MRQKLKALKIVAGYGLKDYNGKGEMTEDREGGRKEFLQRPVEIEYTCDSGSG
jgi:hypothetical protein